MHPFGGTSICPRCSKPVYAAEQVMGPGRKLYHKPCLACTNCNKRLDSFTLLEHDEQPYCKPCHVKNFGTRDLRQANLPHRIDLLTNSPNASPSPLPSSPTRYTRSPPPGHRHPSPSPIRTQGLASGVNNGRVTSPPPILRPNRTLSPTSNRFPSRDSPPFETSDSTEAEESRDVIGSSYNESITNTLRGPNGLPRTVPLSPTKDQSISEPPRSPGKFSAVTLGRSNSSASAKDNDRLVSPLLPTATGTRYGAALGGMAPLVPTSTGTRQWGAGTPKCPRCGKSVYFAEQVKATGKTWHKGCLRCTECSTLLDSSRLTEKDGDPLCHRCYNKLHGPQGSGYALLGKAGG